MAANPESDPTARRKRLVLKSEKLALTARPTGCDSLSRCPVTCPEDAARVPVLAASPNGGAISRYFTQSESIERP